jgi:DNA-binding transcriptional LysR family regulator
LEIQQLKHLIAAVECGNLLKAAGLCNISQSGLSRSIANLEEGVGVQLLLRKPKGVEPTIFGLRVVEHAHVILNEIERCSEDIRSIEACEIGEITFGVTQNYGYYLIPDLISELSIVFPGIHVRVKTGGFLDLAESLRLGAIDFVFGLLGPIEDRGDLLVDRLQDHRSRVVAHVSHPLACKGAPVTSLDLFSARWATLCSEGFQRNFTGFFLSQGLDAPVQVIKTDSLELIRQIIGRTDLLAVLPPDVARAEIERGELVILDCDTPAEQTDVGIITRNGSLVTERRNEILRRIRTRF